MSAYNQDDVIAATALLQHISSDRTRKEDEESEEDKKKSNAEFVKVSKALSVLAERGRQMKLPGALASKTLWEGSKDILPFNEVYQRKNKTRPAYANIMPIIERIQQEDAKKAAAEKILAGRNGGTRPEDEEKGSKMRIDTFGEVSQKAFKGDNKLYHIPRMLTKEEIELLRSGVSQRGRALRAFLKDMSKCKDYSKMECVKNGAFPLAVMKRVEARCAETPTAKLTNCKDLYWSTWYGPDIIRGPDENGKYKFWVLEDNLGYVGGFGDLIDARSILTKTFPELKPALGPDQTPCFYDEMAKHYLAQVKEGEKVVLLYYQRSCAGAAETADNEDRRLVRLFEKRGIVAVPLPGEKGAPANYPSMEIRGAGQNRKVFLLPKKEGKEPLSPKKEDAGGEDPSPAKKKQRLGEDGEHRVGLVILLSEPSDVEAGHASTKLRSAVAEARSRIEDLEEKATRIANKTARAKMTVLKVNQKLELKSTGKLESCIEMKGKILVWTVQDAEGKEVDRIKGPLSWNDSVYKLSGKMTNGEMWSARFNEENGKAFKKNWPDHEFKNLPISAMLTKIQAEDLQNAIERIGQLVGGHVNDKAPQVLYRLLRLEDKKEWTSRMEGRRGLPGLLDAYYAGNVKISNGPGFTPLEDKELCAHVDKLIRYFLKEEPLLETVPTFSFGKGDKGDELLIAQVFDNPKAQENCVVKRVDGRGGDAVWVGAKLSRSDFLESRPLVENEPASFIVQKYTCVSEVDGQIVDLRGPAVITSTDDALSGGPGVMSSPVLWGRGSDRNGNGKVNISDKGFEFTICTAIEEQLVAPVAAKSSKGKGGVLYEKDLIDAVEDMTKGGSKIDLRDARKLWNMVDADGKVTSSERTTVEYILNGGAEFTKAAKEYLQAELQKAPVCK